MARMLSMVLAGAAILACKNPKQGTDSEKAPNSFGNSQGAVAKTPEVGSIGIPNCSQLQSISFNPKCLCMDKESMEGIAQYVRFVTASSLRFQSTTAIVKAPKCACLIKENTGTYEIQIPFDEPVDLLSHRALRFEIRVSNVGKTLPIFTNGWSEKENKTLTSDNAIFGANDGGTAWNRLLFINSGSAKMTRDSAVSRFEFTIGLGSKIGSEMEGNIPDTHMSGCIEFRE